MSHRGVILGAPGAGKGTQARRVCEHLGWAHLATGDLLRAAIQEDSAAGRRARPHMDAGQLVPDEIVFGVLFERLEGGVETFLLDGFPRNCVQAEELDRRLGMVDRSLDVAVDLAVPEEVLMTRILGRRTCSECGQNWHAEFLPTRHEGVCDRCGGPTVRRSDDTREVVARRLGVYHEQTEPLKAYYEKAGLLVAVDGDRPVEVVTAAVEQALAHAGAGLSEVDGRG